MKRSELKQLIRETIEEVVPQKLGIGSQVLIKTQGNQSGHIVQILDNIALVVPWNTGKGKMFYLKDLVLNPKQSKEAMDEMAKSVSAQWEVSFFDKSGEHYSIITQARTKEEAIENAKEFSHESNLEDWEREIFNRAVKVKAVPATSGIKENKYSEGPFTVDGKLVDTQSIEIGNIDRNDYPDFVDAGVESAQFEDGTPLNDNQIDKLNDMAYYWINKTIHDQQLYM